MVTTTACVLRTVLFATEIYVLLLIFWGIFEHMGPIIGTRYLSCLKFLLAFAVFNHKIGNFMNLDDIRHIFRRNSQFIGTKILYRVPWISHGIIGSDFYFNFLCWDFALKIERSCKFPAELCNLSLIGTSVNFLFPSILAIV